MKTKKDLFRECIMEKGFILFGWWELISLLLLLLSGNMWYLLAAFAGIPFTIIHYCIGRLFFNIQRYRIEFRFFGKIREVEIPILL